MTTHRSLLWRIVKALPKSLVVFVRHCPMIIPTVAYVFLQRAAPYPRLAAASVAVVAFWTGMQFAELMRPTCRCVAFMKTLEAMGIVERVEKPQEAKPS